ncbi:integrase [Pollutimonas subterranea]|uniref:Integrase n=1 Tax=Pollutimonas subterranea TaxID=2045210 RepID=A0A2N4TYS5_9BURK|nr:site-specific integrase [Pollutimonas subterranea]PLC47918.1 integrase [Pollutimonas subterranea]
MPLNSEFSAALIPLSPFEGVRVLPEFDGRAGTNRAMGNRPQIAATTDVDAITAWLARFIESPNTFTSYRKEAERLLLWATLALQKPVSSLTHEDLLAYQHFLSDPQPKAQWVMRSGRKVERAHVDWRPFAGPLAPASRRQAIIILNSMFAWLVTAGYLAGNPLSLSRQRARKAKPRVTRYLEDETWSEVKMAIDALPRESDREREHYFRRRWLFSLLYLCGLRISEVTQNSMGGFFCRRDKDGEERWWLEVTGKGEKTRIIPATHELMMELARYRREKGLVPFPSSDETTPLLLPIGNQTRTLTRAAVHTIVKQVFKSAADRIRARGGDEEWKAQRVEQASAHWLRHTAGSNMANNNVDLRHVRDNLGHESISTTNTYLHSSDDARHRETEEHHKIGW